MWRRFGPGYTSVVATEVEARILGVDVAALRRRLEVAGAIRTEDALFREVLFWCVSGSPHEYVRVRDDGRSVILTHKRRDVDAEVREAAETETTAGDFAAAVAIFEGAGLRRMIYREKRRTSYRLGETTVSIDQYPGIPAYAEIESSDAATVRDACITLGIDPARHFSGGVVDVYRHYGKPLAPGEPLAFDDAERQAILAETGQ